MRNLLIVALLFAVSYLLSRPIFSSRWSFAGFRYLFFSGSELLLLGYLAGPRGFALLPASMLDALEPVLLVALGWAGLLFGLQFNRRMLRVYPLVRYVGAFGQAIAAMAITACGGWLVCRWLFASADPTMALRGAAVLALAAGPTSPSSIYYFQPLLGTRGRANRLLKFIAAVDGIPVILALGVFAGLNHLYAGELGAHLPGWQWLVVGIALGVLLGVLLAALVELEFSRNELLLFVLGMVILGAGVARTLHLPTVFLCFVMGVTTANIAWHREEVHKVTAHAEKPIYLTLMLLAGTLVDLSDPRVPILATALLLLRFVGKLVGNLPWRWAPVEPEVRSPWLGMALLSQGGLVVVLALDFGFVYRADEAHAAATGIVVSAVLVAVFLTELVSPLLLKVASPERATRRAGS